MDAEILAQLRENGLALRLLVFVGLFAIGQLFGLAWWLCRRQK